MLPLNEKVKVLNERRKKSHAEGAKIYGKNESSSHEIVKKGEENSPGFTATPQTAEVKTTGHVKWLVKMEKVLNL